MDIPFYNSIYIYTFLFYKNSFYNLLIFWWKNCNGKLISKVFPHTIAPTTHLMWLCGGGG